MAAVKLTKLRHGHELTDRGRLPIVARVRARITVRSNPRVLVPVALAAALVVGAVLVAALVQIVVGLVALVLVGYFGYRLVRFVSKQLASYVAADAEGRYHLRVRRGDPPPPLGAGHLRRARAGRGRQ